MFDIDGLSSEEKNAMEELQMRVETVLDPQLIEDFTLFYRFLKARDFNVDKAEKMLLKHIAWRKAHQISTILQDFVPKEYFRKYSEPCSFGFDKEANILHYLPMGKIDLRDIIKCTTMNGYMKHWIWFWEQTKADIKQLFEKSETKFVPQTTIIVDLDKFSFGSATSKLSAEILARTMNILQDNYPEGMKRMYVINAPGYYVFPFSILKAMMSNAMIQKIHIFGHDGWKEPLLEIIDADVLPAFLGGKRTDPDGNPMGMTFVTHGGKIPPCYYLSNEDRYFKDKSRVTKIVVPRFGKKEVPVDVQEEGSVVQWEFLVKNKDIGFGLFYEESEKVIKVLPVIRYDTIDGVEVGTYKTKHAGKYVIMFDNSYSWLSSKEIEYSVTVIKPKL